MNSIDAFQRIKDQERQAKEWVGLIGAHYSGGGGGVGKVATAGATVTIYHQAYDGAVNYHECPNDEMQGALNDAASIKANEILALALRIMSERVRLKAGYAEKDAKAVMEALGK